MKNQPIVTPRNSTAGIYPGEGCNNYFKKVYSEHNPTSFNYKRVNRKEV